MQKALSGMRFPEIRSRYLAISVSFRGYTRYEQYFRQCKNLSLNATLAYAYARTYADG